MLKALARTASLFAALTLLTFALAEWAPGDFLTTLRAAPEVSAETERAVRSRLQLDRPWVERYLAWSRSAVAGEFGESLAYGVPVRQLLNERLPNTLWLNLVATMGAWLLALAAGAWAAAHAGSWADRLIGVLQAVLAGVPELLLALVGLWLFGGRAWLPYAVLLFGALPTLLVHVRAALRAAVTHPSVAAAGAHGIGGVRLWRSYIAPLAAPQLLALAGLSFGGLLSASLLVEAALSYPGLGSLMLDAIQARDTAVVAAIVTVAGGLLLLANLLAEAAHRRVDPRRASAQ